MNANHVPLDPGLPEYASDSVGKPDLRSIANRIRELAALLAAQECHDAAAHLTQAYGTLLGLISTRRMGSTGNPD